MQVFLNILTAALTIGILAIVIGVGLGLLDGHEDKKVISKSEKTARKKTNLRAFVKCNGEDCEKKYTYADAEDCAVASRLAGGPNACAYSCLGLGSCVRACPENAISVESGVAVVCEDKCIGCGTCAEVCPRKIIELVPVDRIYRVRCSNRDAGAKVRKVCDEGCIGCLACVNTCKYDAVVLEGNLAVVDYEKCCNCGECSEVCPRGIITAPKKEESEEKFDESEYFSINIAEEN